MLAWFGRLPQRFPPEPNDGSGRAGDEAAAAGAAASSCHLGRGGQPCERYYIPKDMHFSERGLQAYGLAVARYLSTAIPGD
jgi:hypothetical protein